MEKIKAGLIGCGRIGYTFDLDPKRKGVWTHAKAYAKNPEVEFIGVHDLNRNIASNCATKYSATFLSFKDMVNHCDIISVAVAENAHESVLTSLLHWIRRADNPPKVLWVEKPFTARYEIARHFVDKFAEYNCHVHINYQRRFCDGFRKLQEMGEPKGVNINYTRGLYNTASHFVDLMIGLYGPKCDVKQINQFGDFALQYDNFIVHFSMLQNLKYNVCDTIFYYDDKIVTAPPLQTHLNLRLSIASDQYSEYQDLQQNGTILELKYEPMLEQVSVIVDSIKIGKYYRLNNGLDTLKVLEKASK